MQTMTRMILVKAIYDPEAGVWLSESSDVHGLRIEAPTFEALVERLPGVIEDLLADDGETGDIPIEVVAHRSTRVRLGIAA
ncbi:hypothetical protein ASG17_14020 [Brevundimonas sp. Leaf363]|nr:hypothetical protein ASG17_14020 [Brevundimonas sp. Leaf363]